MESVVEALEAARDKGLLPAGSSILLAVSGGADSMALLEGAVEVAQKARWKLAVGHVHHGWRRREADRDLAFVREHAQRRGLPFFERRRDARRGAETEAIAGGSRAFRPQRGARRDGPGGRWLAIFPDE